MANINVLKNQVGLLLHVLHKSKIYSYFSHMGLYFVTISVNMWLDVLSHYPSSGLIISEILTDQQS